ncbi:hypothetical protein [Microvirga brassicacearum]|uniref:Uncharacterized protein n=1 Tax=Microvirga brassicacearum TaxID=2580413 RepID=A0A5N3PAN3_9HYPH|nr:hypothetical protein [Microvirga brassicacearum]KAB0266799.1 hypothetical protein FEZ63_11915 [Microvirga brassicacearum]
MTAMAKAAPSAGSTEMPYDAEDLMRAIIAFGPYRAVLIPLCDEIARIGLGNRQIHAALHTVAERSGFAATGRLRRADLGPEAAPLRAFLEHIRFASPAFLRSVGEWPLGEARG